MIRICSCQFVRAWHYAGACSEMFTSDECLVKRFLGMLKVIDLQPSNWLGLVHQKLCSSALAARIDQRSKPADGAYFCWIGAAFIKGRPAGASCRSMLPREWPVCGIPAGKDQLRQMDFS